MILTMENTIDKIEERINDLAKILDVQTYDIKNALKEYLPQEQELVSSELLTQLNEKMVGKIIQIKSSLHKLYVMKVNRITFDSLQACFVINGNLICSTPDMKIGNKTFSYYPNHVYYYGTDGEYNINCLDDLIVKDTEEIKKLMSSELNYMRLVSSHFYE